jgi:predicted dinucleotide-binding enzyme
MVYYGDDEDAKRVAATLIRDVGFDPIDAGALRVAATWNRSLYSWENSRTRVKAARSSRIVSSDSGSRSKACYVPFSTTRVRSRS